MMRLPVALCAVLLISAGCKTAPPVPMPYTPTPSPTPSAAPSEKPVAVNVVVPAGINAGLSVWDRRTGTFLVQVNSTGRFRSASLVKVLIALDYLWNRGPGYAVPVEDRHQLEIMLRSSDDGAASYFYQKIGGEPALVRMIERLGLQNTRPPSAVGLKGWGSTTLSADDIVRVYQYILDKSPAGMREVVMGHLHAATPCGTDHYFQSFGIPTAVPRPWAVKQGWWGFGDQPIDLCSASGPELPTPAAMPAIKGATPALMSGRVLHSTGTVGEGDRYIVAVLTQYPSGTPFTTAAGAITVLTRSLPIH